MSEFGGFPATATAFFAGLEADNSKAYWQANKATWETEVRAPMLAFLDAADGAFRPFRLFRMNRDVRFAKDKSPYKTMLGAVNERPGGSITYVHLWSAGLLAASGMYLMARDQIGRFRDAVADERHGAELEAILAGIGAAGVAIGYGGEEPLKTVPRGYPKEHPRAHLLRWKGLVATGEVRDPAVLAGPDALSRIEAIWRAALPLNRWLDECVGPSRDPGRR